MTAALPYALSVHHFISQVGDYVGFAAIIAVAIMVLLLFAHARETAELRRRAQDAEDELSVLHDQVQWLRDTSRPGAAAPSAAAAPPGGAPGVVAPPAAAGVGRSSGAPVPPPAGAPVPAPASAAGRSAAALATGAGVASAGAGGMVAPVPAPASAAAAAGRAVVFGAPVGVGAPALTSATKLIPPTDEELRAVAAATAARAETGPATTHAAPGPLAAAAAGGAAGVAAGAVSGSGSATAVATPPPPATATAAAAAGGNGKPPRRAGIAADPGAPRGGGRPGQPVPVTSPRRNYAAGSEPSGRRRISRTLIAAVTVLVIAIVVAAVIVLGGGSSKPHTAASGQASPATKSSGKASGKGKGKTATVNVNPSTVTVTVLNGTQTANLATDVGSKLSAKGFQLGTPGNATDQSMSTTIVGYVPGVSGAKNDAYAVARTLGLAQTTVKPVSSANQTVACSSTPTNCPDQVIVTIGADLNSDAA